MNQIDRMELKISKLLRIGVMVAGSVILLGWILAFRADKDPFANLQTYKAFNLLDSLQMHLILQNWGNIIVYVGLGILISLPVLRVLLSTILFLKQKEKIMALLGATVLIGLLLSFSLGIEA
jgi:uncharacterized membrane protein